MKTVKNKSPLAGADIVNFMNKKGKLKESLAAQAQIPHPPDGAAPAKPVPHAGSPKHAARPAASVQGSHNRITSFLKDKGVKK